MNKHTARYYRTKKADKKKVALAIGREGYRALINRIFLKEKLKGESIRPCPDYKAKIEEVK